MTDLTEQWKKGELPNDWYYIKTKDDIEIDGFDGGVFGSFSFMEIDQILDKVPSYEQWQAKLEENAQLKELLKECSRLLSFEHEHYEDENMVKEISQVLGEE